ncbi:hypothetical protein A4G19_03455 [Pasteurellaceae bacterium Macca]|nr:hypothetical protein [Pasteurellaceae bacterium Macca]
MSKPVLFFAKWCPDTYPFVDELKKLGIEYEEVEITETPVGYKQFLKLRDRHSAFDHAKQNGYIGVPALLLENDEIILDLAELGKLV